MLNNNNKIIMIKIIIIITLILLILYVIIPKKLCNKFDNIQPTYYWNNTINNLYFNKSLKKHVVFYFIHGFGGAPDQIKLIINVIRKHYTDHKIIIKCANHVNASNVKLRAHIRYSKENIELFHKLILDDINLLLKKYKKNINIIVSSNGMYDFMSIYSYLNKNTLKNLTLIWVAMMDYTFELNFFKKMLLSIFPSVNNIKFIPGHNLLKYINTELEQTFDGYKLNDNFEYEKFIYKKIEIEGRINYMFFNWSDLESIDILTNRNMLQIQNLNGEKIDIRCIALVPLKDGYWNVSEKKANTIMNDFFTNYKMVYTNQSHLWCINDLIIDKFINIFKNDKGSDYEELYI
jgi:hypothetical protein